MTTPRLAERPARTASGARSGWPIALGLVLLSAVPLTAGVMRLVQLAGGPQVFPPDERFSGVPLALLLHILSSAVFALVGTMQLLPRFRRRHLTWHRRAGRVLTLAGLVVAASALWMTLLYQPQPGTGRLLFAFRMVVGTAMAASLVLGFTAIRRRDVVAHRAWMVRAFALGLGAGTQVLTQGLTEALVGTDVVVGDLAKGAGWVLNLAVAEWLLRRPARAVRRVGASA
jgi:hypothetical protein